MDLKRVVSAGIVDAATASLATFVVGLYAARMLSASELGVYALFFSAFMLAVSVPSYLLLRPGEIASLKLPPSDRVDVLVDTVRIGTPPAAASSTAAAVLAAVIAPGSDLSIILPLAVTSVLAGFLWPFQDHVRQLLHMADASWSAALASVINLTVVIGFVGVGLLAGMQPAWVPFGALTAGNLLSFCVLLPRAHCLRGAEQILRRSDLIRSGRYFLTFGVAPTLGGFVVSALIARLASAAALGYAEAARIVAQPVLVMAMGLAASIGPRSLDAGANLDREAAKSVSRVFIILIAAAGVVSVLMVGWVWPANVVASFLPQAYVVPGLVAATIAANVLNGAVNPFRSELLGAGLEKDVAKAESAAAVAQSVGALSAALVGSFARPISLAMQAGVQLAGERAYARRLWRRHKSEQAADDAPGSPLGRRSADWDSTTH